MQPLDSNHVSGAWARYASVAPPLRYKSEHIIFYYISSLISISKIAVRALNFFCTIIITEISEKVKIRKYEIFKERKGLVCPRCQASLRFVVGRRRRTWTATPHPKCGVLPLHHVLYIGTLYGARTHILSLRGILPDLLEEQSIFWAHILRCRNRTDNFSVLGKCLNLLTNHERAFAVSAHL